MDIDHNIIILSVSTLTHHLFLINASFKYGCFDEKTNIQLLTDDDDVHPSEFLYKIDHVYLYPVELIIE